jgi:transcriptional regulator with XRE-family HTH domain
MHALSGLEFKIIALRANLTIASICKESKVSEATVSKWINGHQDIMLDGTYNKLITAYEKLKSQKGG